MLGTFDSFKFDEKSVDDDDDLSLFPTAKPMKSLSLSNPLAPPTYVAPSFRAASEYRELLLPRRIYDENQPTSYRLARPGELIDEKGNPATLYDFMRTPAEALDEFGIGVSLYFRILRALILIFLICGFISIIAMNENHKHQVTTKSGRFDSNNCLISSYTDSIPQTQNSTINNINYKTNQIKINISNLSNLNSTHHVVYTPIRILGSVYGSTANDLKLSRQGASDILITGLLVLVTAIAGMTMKHQINKIDTSQQTTKDYSVVILNPPKNIDDPQEYFDFFSQFGEIVLVTIVKTNGKIFRLFADKKRVDTTLIKVDQSLRMLFSETTVDWFTRLKISFFSWWKIYLHNSSNKIEQQLYTAAHETSVPWQVFITFNKEFSRNVCLEKMSVGKLDVWLNNKEKQSEIVFHDRILRVKIAEEPTDIIYFNNDLTYYQQLQYSLASYAICLLFLYLALSLVRYVYFRFKGIVGAAIITLINTSLPLLIKFISKNLEKHHTDGELQSSILIKLVVTRCINGTIFVFWVNRHDIFSNDALQAIQNILIAENIAILIRLSNLSDVAQRYLLTTFDITQTEMNSKWQGAEWTLAERYSDCLKNIFFTLFYCVPLPSLFFLASFTFINTYFVDKYSLFRLWKRKPANGESLGKLSRHFLTFSVFFHILMSIFFFSNWPFKSICDINSSTNQIVYFDFDYSYLEKENDERYSIVHIYVVSLYTAILILIIYTLIHIFKKIGKIFTPQKFRCFNLFINFDSKEYHPVEFRDIEGSAAYIPHYHPPDLLNPLFGCDLTELPVQFSPLTSNTFGDYVIDPRDYSIVKSEYFSYLTENDLKKLFSSVEFFEDPFRLCEKLDDSLEEGNIITPEAYASSTYVMDFDLPSGWMCRQLLDGQLFYVDLNNETVTWRKPTKKCRFQRSLGIQNNKIDQLLTIANTLEILPPGWEVAYNSSNVPYFIDHNTKKTHWSIPEEILHPEPLSDNDDLRSETTASSVLSYFSQRSLGESIKFDGQIFKSMRNIGKSMKNIFGKNKSSQKDLNRDESIKGALENFELDDVNDIEDHSIHFKLQDSDEIKDNNYDDLNYQQQQQQQQEQQQQQMKIQTQNEKEIELKENQQHQILRSNSLLLRRKPYSSLSISTSIKSFESASKNNNNDKDDNNSNNNNNNNEINSELNISKDKLIKSQGSGEYDGDISIDEFPVLILSELSPSHINEHKTPTNKYTSLNSDLYSNLNENENEDHLNPKEEMIYTSELQKIFHSPSIKSSSKTSPTFENSNSLNLDSREISKVNSCKRVEQDVLAFVFGVESNSNCSEDDHKIDDDNNNNDQNIKEDQYHQHIEKNNDNLKLNDNNNNNKNNNNNNSSPQNELIVVPRIEIKSSKNQNDNQIQSNNNNNNHNNNNIKNNDDKISPISNNSDNSKSSSLKKSQKQKISNNLTTPKSQTISKVSPLNSLQTPLTYSLPDGWEECYTPKGKLFYINHKDKTTHWNLPNT